jgi:hypothetical protein
VVGATDPRSRILGFLVRIQYYNNISVINIHSEYLLRVTFNVHFRMGNMVDKVLRDFFKNISTLLSYFLLS